MSEVMEAKKLVDATATFEQTMRAAVQKQIAEERAKAVEKLKQMEERYKDKGERGGAREIGKEIDKLEEWLEQNGHVAPEKKTEPKSDIFIYGKEYLFSSDQIKGRLIFFKEGKVNVIFKRDAAPQNVMWQFEERRDHIVISDEGELGKVYISEVPQSEKNSIMIRLGGELRHHVVTASGQ